MLVFHILLVEFFRRRGAEARRNRGSENERAVEQVNRRGRGSFEIGDLRLTIYDLQLTIYDLRLAIFQFSIGMFGLAGAKSLLLWSYTMQFEV